MPTTMKAVATGAGMTMTAVTMMTTTMMMTTNLNIAELPKKPDLVAFQGYMLIRSF